MMISLFNNKNMPATSMYNEENKTILPKTQEVEITVIEDDEDGIAKKNQEQKCPNNYGGVGIEIGFDVIQKVFAGYPADRAGIKPGDIVVQISDGKEIRGPVGSKVTLVIFRDGLIINFELIRESICTE